LLEQEDPALTPLQEKLEGVAKGISKFGLWSAIVILAVLLIRFIIEKAIKQKWEDDDANKLVKFVLVAVKSKDNFNKSEIDNCYCCCYSRRLAFISCHISCLFSQKDDGGKKFS